MHLGIDFSKILVDFGRQVGAMWAPRRAKTPQFGVQGDPEAAQEAPKTIQEPPKSCPRGVQETAQRCFGARNRPRAAQEPHKSRPRAAQTPQLRVQDGPQAAQEAPKTIQEPPKSCPRGVQEAAQTCL